MNQAHIDIVVDLICPWCYIGARRLDQALDQLPDVDARVVYHPFLLDPSIPPEGRDLRERLRAKYGGDPEQMFARVEEAAQDTGIPLDYSRIQRTPNTLPGHTLLRHALPRGTQAALAQALFEAYFLSGKNIGALDVLAEVAAPPGFTEDEVRAIAGDPGELAKTRAQAQQWSRRGVNGVPFTIVGERYAVSGAQPVEVFVDAIRRAAAEAS